MPTPTPSFWKRKLAAYLHDSPDKVLSIVDHEERARSLSGHLLPDEQSRKEADWTASAADRLPFPPSSSTRTPLSCFRHPLGQASIPFDESKLPIGLAEEISQKTRPVLQEDDARAAFIATWRFWRNWASAVHPDFALYPAETRLPDHTIWNHLAVTSAMQGCLGGEPWKANEDKGVTDHPCFLLFTIGPVQEFISQARSTRDLWSGSYLLSYLIGHALRRIALDFGPDHVIFPNLCDVPLMDLLLKDEVWSKTRTSNGADLFSAFDFYGSTEDRQRLLTPSLPNRFLAVLPTAMTEHRDRGSAFASAEDYANHLASSLRCFYCEEVAQSVKNLAAECFGADFHSERFDKQVAQALEIHWQTLPWPKHFSDIASAAAPLPLDDAEKGFTPRSGLGTILDLAEHGADSRYLTDDGKPKNVAAGWSALYSLAEWALDGTKSLRPFTGWNSGQATTGRSNTKDSLNGKEEAVLQVGNDGEKLSENLRKHIGKAKLLKDGENFGASSLIKRLWPYTWVCKQHTFTPEQLVMPNTRSIAAHKPWEHDADDEVPDSAGEKYFAVLALDGDSMGQWISGSKTPALRAVLSDEAAKVYRDHGADLGNRRPLSPAWHLQFAEALGNFAQHAARRTVEAFDGRLIYAGGDDVLALLPADMALECARALRLAFQGSPELNTVAKGVLIGRDRDKKSDRTTPLFQVETPGFLRLTPGATKRHGTGAALLDDPVGFPAIVPGPAADCSVGIAMAHFKSPLQDVVKAAQAAEKRAKGELGRSAVAVSLFKRSGEIVEWGCQWESGGLALYEEIARRLDDRRLTGKFPHRVCALLDPYRNGSSEFMSRHATMGDAREFNAAEIIEKEFDFAICRQSGAAAARENEAELVPLLQEYLQCLRARRREMEKQGKKPSQSEAQHLIAAVIGLCTTVAFAHRTRPESEPSKGN
ncbi:MAG: type III-B CRISPR-associated protein Cas10/Cmr2 [Verrucomicrobiales bacterium]